MVVRCLGEQDELLAFKSPTMIVSSSWELSSRFRFGGQQDWRGMYMLMMFSFSSSPMIVRPWCSMIESPEKTWSVGSSV